MVKYISMYAGYCRNIGQCTGNCRTLGPWSSISVCMQGIVGAWSDFGPTHHYIYRTLMGYVPTF